MYRNGEDARTKSSFLPSKFHGRYIITFTAVFGTCFLILCSYNGSKLEISPRQKYFPERYTINTEGCNIPQLQPWDETIKQYVFYPKTIKPCRNSTFPLLDNNKTHIWIKQDNKKYYDIIGLDNIMCCYSSFYRPLSINDITSINVDGRVKYNKCIPFSKEVKVKDEFVKVECENNNAVIYKQLFSFTPKKKFSHDINEISEDKPAYNIIVLGVDAVSRLNIHRTMPKTLHFLKNKGAVELLGYNKVGDNTFPNVVPMLLGIKEAELKKTCLPNSWSTFDNCPFIWNWFKEAGYYTAFGEDTSSLGTFNYLRPGFIGTPTDYYLHTFINEAERNVGNNKDFNSFLCMNEKRFYDVLLNYIEDLVTTLKFTKLFGFFWEVTMSHDYLNYPMTMDTSYERFLKKLDGSKYLDDTIFFLISDHGIRWGEIRSTKQGRLEERLPFVSILVPQSFRNEYAEAFKNLKLNSERLSSPFDIHATFYDLINLDDIKNEQIEARKRQPYGRKRSISLFLPIPKNRTCQVAEIDDHWCTCQKSFKLALNSEQALNAASQLLLYLNKLLSAYHQCAPLYLVEIIEVSEVEVGKPDHDEVGWQEFMVVLRTDPGDALFEATLRYVDLNWSVTGTVSRLNLYGDQSNCISDSQLKLYCFCI